MMDGHYIEMIAALEQHIFVAYFALLAVAVFIERRISSIVIALFVLCSAQAMSYAISAPLLAIASHDGLHFKFVWYCFWLMSNTFFIWIMVRFHKIHQVRTTSVAQSVSLLFVVISLINAADFIDRATINSNIFAEVYRLVTLTSTIGIVPVILYLWFFEYRKNLTAEAAGA